MLRRDLQAGRHLLRSGMDASVRLAADVLLLSTPISPLPNQPHLSAPFSLQVSRRHATLEVVAGQLQLVDQGAVNGTFVNDHRIEPSSARWAGGHCVLGREFAASCGRLSNACWAPRILAACRICNN